MRLVRAAAVRNINVVAVLNNLLLLRFITGWILMASKNEKEFSNNVKQALEDILRRISFRAEVFYRGQLCDDWALDTSGSGHVNFHIVCHGDCWLHLPKDNVPIQLRNGDIVVFPHDAAHVIGSSKDKPSAFGVKISSVVYSILENTVNEHP